MPSGSMVASGMEFSIEFSIVRKANALPRITPMRRGAQKSDRRQKTIACPTGLQTASNYFRAAPYRGKYRSARAGSALSAWLQTWWASPAAVSLPRGKSYDGREGKNMAKLDTVSDIDWMACELIEQVPGKVSGRPVVRGTRIMPDSIVNSHELGDSIDEIHEGFPTLSVAQIQRLIHFAQTQRQQH